MAVHREHMLTTARKAKRAKEAASKDVVDTKEANQQLVNEHLPPLFLVFVILFCSGTLLVFALRDFLSTGRNMAGSWDEALLHFTKSTYWFQDIKGWKSTQGGFSAVMRITTDENNMGGFFVRKVAGAAAVGVHLQKLFPMLVHPTGAQWIMGDFRPMLNVAFFSNLAIAAFYYVNMRHLKAAGAFAIPRAMMVLLGIESLTILFCLATQRSSKPKEAIRMVDGKTPKSNVSNIVTRTIAIVSGAVSVIAFRDLFFPGSIFEFLPRDDIYLEWTNAFLHSPPDDSPEAIDHGLESPLYIGDKFISQFMALHVLILCMYKFTTAFFIRYGSDGRGEIKCKMIWKPQAIASGMMLFTFRMFQPSAFTASLDLRWHLMCLGYETFILALYAFA